MIPLSNRRNFISFCRRLPLTSQRLPRRCTPTALRLRTVVRSQRHHMNHLRRSIAHNSLLTPHCNALCHNRLRSQYALGTPLSVGSRCFCTCAPRVRAPQRETAGYVQRLANIVVRSGNPGHCAYPYTFETCNQDNPQFVQLVEEGANKLVTRLNAWNRPWWKLSSADLTQLSADLPTCETCCDGSGACTYDREGRCCGNGTFCCADATSGLYQCCATATDLCRNTNEPARCEFQQPCKTDLFTCPNGYTRPRGMTRPTLTLSA